MTFWTLHRTDKIKLTLSLVMGEKGDMGLLLGCGNTFTEGIITAP
jgi:hypothetical protein